jgi:hypothetical protein
MIISDKYKYVFVQLPRTGSTAIGRELCKLYDGKQVLYKHCTYYEFLKVASEERKDYFVFSCIRNPLDDAVSRFFKLKTNYRERYTDPEKVERRRKNFVERIEDRLFHYIQENDVDFETFFLKVYRIPYNDWSSLDHDELDFVIRFENLGKDFAEVLQLIGIEQVRTLPVRNKTPKRKTDYLTHYTPATVERAKRVFGPYMKQWGYEIPNEWGDDTVPWWNQAEFRFFTFLRTIYWKYMRSFAYPERIRKAEPI